MSAMKCIKMEQSDSHAVVPLGSKDKAALQTLPTELLLMIFHDVIASRTKEIRIRTYKYVRRAGSRFSVIQHDKGFPVHLQIPPMVRWDEGALRRTCRRFNDIFEEKNKTESGHFFFQKDVNVFKFDRSSFRYYKEKTNPSIDDFDRTWKPFTQIRNLEFVFNPWRDNESMKHELVFMVTILRCFESLQKLRIDIKSNDDPLFAIQTQRSMWIESNLFKHMLWSLARRREDLPCSAPRLKEVEIFQVVPGNCLEFAGIGQHPRNAEYMEGSSPEFEEFAKVLRDLVAEPEKGDWSPGHGLTGISWMLDKSG